MKRNITQDVIPPKKTIRNVELFYKPKRLEKKMGLQVASSKVETAKKPRKVQAEKKEDLVPVRDNLGREIEELKRMLSNL